MPQIEVILSPALFHLYDHQGKNVVVIDILRATSAMVTALAHGVQSIIPVAELDEALEMKEFGYTIAGERNAEKVNGFDLGNSPLEFQHPKLKGRDIVLTTTNGTRCIEMCKGAHQIIAGAFLNLDAVAAHLIASNTDTLLFCAGWKNKFNLEDTLFAGALAEKLQGHFDSECDSTIAAIQLYRQNAQALDSFMDQASHVKRFRKFGLLEDKDFCMQHSIYNIVPVMEGKHLVKMDQVMASTSK